MKVWYFVPDLKSVQDFFFLSSSVQNVQNFERNTTAISTCILSNAKIYCMISMLKNLNTMTLSF